MLLLAAWHAQILRPFPGRFQSVAVRMPHVPRSRQPLRADTLYRARVQIAGDAERTWEFHAQR